MGPGNLALGEVDFFVGLQPWLNKSLEEFHMSVFFYDVDSFQRKFILLLEWQIRAIRAS